MVGPWITFVVGEILACEDAQQEAIIAVTGQAPATLTAAFDTNGAEKLYIITDLDKVTPATTVVQTTTQGTVNDGANAVDKDSGTAKSTLVDSSGATDPIQRFDFLTQDSTRVVLVSLSGLTNPNNPSTSVLKWRWAANDLVFSSFITLNSRTFGAGALAQRTFELTAQTNLRYIEIGYTYSGVSSNNGFCHECWDKSEGLGVLQSQTLQVLDTTESVWHNLPDSPSMGALDSGSGDKTQIVVADTVFPKHASNLRYQAVLTAKADITVVIVKVKPCET